MSTASLNPSQMSTVRQASSVYRNGIWSSDYQGQLAMDIDELFSLCVSCPDRDDFYQELCSLIEVWKRVFYS